ncbi:hypothetical protein JL107_00940 [Nakamurella flavida]|uniref:Uncharacterized protein n=1 Tax=Nakamurella flavida TaxID=363630 RepID=A0A938YH66_9ACTN|nr:hypothetical protein [Nakamurella flavida]MBM9474999.1 hypothetical protein [Nakamurella flavida]MDP9776568.1 hypothetical protein [Nakamurella flavida]
MGTVDHSSRWWLGGVGRTVVIAYLVARTWQLVMMGPVLEGPDSGMYRAPDAGWLDWGATSWDGSSLRPWPSTLLYALLPTDRARVLAQFVLSTVAWGFLIHRVGRLPVRRWIAGAAAGVIAVLALTPTVSAFDTLIGAEAVSFALLAGFAAAVLHAVQVGPRPTPLALMVVTGWALCLIRPVLGLILFVPLLVVVRGWWQARRDDRRSGSVRWLVTAGVVLVLVGTAAANVLSSNATAEREWGDWRGTPGLAGRTIQQWGVFAQSSPSFPELVQEFVARDGAPACLLVDAVQVAQPVVPGQSDPCAQGRVWVSTEFVGALARTLATDPMAARRYIRDGLADVSLLRADGETSLPTLVPDPVTGLFFADGPNVDVFALWTLLALGSLVLARARGHRRTVPVIVLFALAAAYIGLAGTVVLSPTDVSRVGLPATLLARVFLVVVAALVVEQLTGSHRSRREITTEAGPGESGPGAGDRRAG